MIVNIYAKNTCCFDVCQMCKICRICDMRCMHSRDGNMSKNKIDLGVSIYRNKCIVTVICGDDIKQYVQNLMNSNGIEGMATNDNEVFDLKAPENTDQITSPPAAPPRPRAPSKTQPEGSAPAQTADTDKPAP